MRQTKVPCCQVDLIELKLKKKTLKNLKICHKKDMKNCFAWMSKKKWGDPADEILRAVIDTELNFNNRESKMEALVQLYSKLFDKKHYHGWCN